MRIDLFTKAALFAIVVLLALETTHAQSVLPALQFVATPVGYSFFDARTGEVWEYSGTALVKKYRMTKPGQPLAKE